jgi:hypothetical protein
MNSLTPIQTAALLTLGILAAVAFAAVVIVRGFLQRPRSDDFSRWLARAWGRR